MKQVIIDCGHGPGASTPGSRSRGYSEEAIVRGVARRVQTLLSTRSVSVRIIDSGPYEQRQTSRLVETADLYVCLHCDVGGPRDASPYALCLHRGRHIATVADIAYDYARAVGLRLVVGQAGSESWPRGEVLMRHISEDVPAMILELGPIDRPETDALWGDLDRVALALADALAV